MKKMCLLLALLLALGALDGIAEENSPFTTRSTGSIDGYSGPGGAVTIPAEIDGKPVLSLYDSALANDRGITELIVSEGVQALNDASTYHMSALEKVTLPETLRALGETNFSRCEKLREITLPASLIFVGRNCFNWCDALSSVTFLGPAPVFDQECFTVTPDGLVILAPDDQVEAYRAVLPENVNIQPSGQNALLTNSGNDPDDFLFDPDSGTLQEYTGQDAYVQVPAEIGGVPVRHIGAYAFEGNNFIYRVSLPDGLETIGDGSFRSVSRLGWIDMPDSVVSFGERAFMNFWGAGFHFPARLEAIGPEAFAYTNLGAALHLPENLKTIGSEAFVKAKLLKVYFPAGIQAVGSEAFAGTAVNYLYFDGMTLPDIASDAFEGLSITDVDLNWKASKQAMLDAQAAFDAMGQSARVWRMQNPNADYPSDGLSTYENGLMTGYTGQMTHIRPWDTFDGETVTGIADGALKGNQTVEYFSVPYNDAFVSIGAEAFADSAVKEADLFDSVTHIGEAAFRNSALETLTLPASVQAVGEYAFAGCAQLKTITLLCDPAILPDSAFAGCNGVTTLRTALDGGEDSIALASALGLNIPGLQPTAEPTMEPTPEPTPEPTAEPTMEPTPEPTLAPTAAPVPPAPADYERLGGVWYLTAMEMGGQTMNPADFGVSIVMSLNADGTAETQGPDENSLGQWTAQENGVLVTLNGSTELLALQEDGSLRGEEEGAGMVFAREAPEGPSFSPAPAVAARLEEFGGRWQAAYIVSEDMTIPADGPLAAGLCDMVFGTSDLTVAIDGLQVSLFGREETFAFEDGQLKLAFDSPEGQDLSFLNEIISLRQDGMLSVDTMGMTIYCQKIEGPQIQANPKGETGDIPLEVKFVCTSADSSGHILDASALGAEYAILFHADGTADFTMSGAQVPGLTWWVEDGAAVMNYYGAGQLRFTPNEQGLSLDFFGSMIMQFEAVP